MTQEEMKKEFCSLYNMMANSNDVNFMRVFGNAHKEMFNWFVANKPDLATEWLDKLESIKWRNYLTQKEAEQICSSMTPKAPWPKDTWKQAMTSLGIVMEDEPYYNSCALWVEMNKVYSDHAETLATAVWGKPLAEIPTETLVKAINALAVDNLRDKDGVYNIREYFSL